SKVENLLKELGIASIDEGKERLRATRKLDEAITRKSARLSGLAPDGVDTLGEALALDEKRLGELEKELGGYPEPKEGVQSEREAGGRFEITEEALKKAEKAAHDDGIELSRAAQAAKSAAEEWARLDIELKSPERRRREEDVATRLERLAE